MAVAAAVVGAIAAIAGVAESSKQGRKAERAQEKSQRLQATEASLKNARARRKRVAEARVARAQTIAQAEGAGVSGGSQVAGAVGSIQTQAASNESFANQLQTLDQQQFSAASSFNRAISKKQTAQALGSTFSNTAFKFA